MNIELRSYSLEIAEMFLIKKALDDHPHYKGKEIAKLLKISRSSFYRKLKVYQSEEFHSKLIDEGYTLDNVLKLTYILK